MREITTRFANNTTIELNEDVIALVDFIASPDCVSKMIEATMIGKPALGAIVREVEERFGDSDGMPLNHKGPGKNAKNRRNVGWIVRFIMREYGFTPISDSERTRIGADSRSKYFGNAAVYRRTDNIPNYEILSQPFVTNRKLEAKDIFINSSNDDYEIIELGIKELDSRRSKLSLNCEFISTFLQHSGYRGLVKTEDIEAIFAGAKIPCIELNEAINNMLSFFESFNVKKEHGYHVIYGTSTNKALQAFYQLEIKPETVKGVYVFFNEWDAILHDFYNIEAEENDDVLVNINAPRMIIETEDQDYWFDGFTCGYAGIGCGGTQKVLMKLGILVRDEYPVNEEIQSYRVLHYFKSHGVWTYSGEDSKRDVYDRFADANEGLYRRNGHLVLTQGDLLRKNKMWEVEESEYEWFTASDYFLKKVKSVEILTKEEALSTGHVTHWLSKDMIYQIIVKDSENKELWLTYPFEDIVPEKRKNFVKYMVHLGVDVTELKQTKSLLDKLVSSKKDIYGKYLVKGMV